MSAFFCSDLHFAVLAERIFLSSDAYPSRLAAFKALRDANKRSLKSRYPGCRFPRRRMPNEMDIIKDAGQWVQGVMSNHRLSVFNAAVCKQIACFDYQTCEFEGWEKTKLCRVLNKLRAQYGESYDAAESIRWGI